MKNNEKLFRAAKIAGAMAAMFLAAGQASAHVGYGHALYDDSGTNPNHVVGSVTGTVAEETIMHLTDANKGAASCQGLGCPTIVSQTATSNAGFAESRNNKYWGNTHDNRFMWFYISQPTYIHFTITGNPNADYVSAMLGSSLNGIATPISTLNPGFLLFKGKASPAAHDGAYGSFNKGFAAWSSWAQQAIPAGQFTERGKRATQFAGVGNPNSEGNPVFKRMYGTDAGSANLPSSIIDPGITQHMGVFGGYEVRGRGPNGERGFWISNNLSQVTYPDGQPSSEHEVFLKYIAKGANPTGNSLNSGIIKLTEPGVYSLVIGGANQTEAEQLVEDAMLTGMGPEGCKTDASGNCLNGSAATATDWDRYKNVDRRARSFTIQFDAQPVTP